MALSTLQTLLLVNLMYTKDCAFPCNYLESCVGQKLEVFLNKIEWDELKEAKELGSLMTINDWVKILLAVKNDKMLNSLELAETYVDKKQGGGYGFSALFLDQKNLEAYVVFKGTESESEWRDDFRGATVSDMEDGVSTIQQVHALEWYQEAYQRWNLGGYHVTVTGHSKGGNKAKYITILDPTVERCLSFDGQGFSDYFIRKYLKEIKANMHKSNNHNLNNDPVNLLLNDFGVRYYYEGYEVGNANGGFAENHCPNSFFDFSDGSTSSLLQPKMKNAERGQGAGLPEIDQFINSLCRHVSVDKQLAIAEMFAEVVIGARENKDTSFILDHLTEEEANRNDTSYVIAYGMNFVSRMPRLHEKLMYAVEYYGLDKFKKVIELFSFLLRSELFYPLVLLAAKAASNISDKQYERISDLIRKTIEDKRIAELKRQGKNADEKPDPDQEPFIPSKQQTMNVLKTIINAIYMKDRIFDVPDGTDLTRADAPICDANC